MLKLDLPDLMAVTRAKRSIRLPTVLNREEVRALLDGVDDPVRGLIVRLL